MATDGAQPPIWNRKTPWRQGHVLPEEAVAALCLADTANASDIRVVVVSHDCDLVNDDLAVEPDVEIIVGTLTKPNGSFAYSKSPRTLHLSMASGAESVTVELIATNKKKISKLQLAGFSPDDRYVLLPSDLAVLRRWLAVRYNRSAFPDDFVSRMRKTKLDGKLKTILTKHGEGISAVLFDIDGGKRLNRDDGTLYELAIVLTYPPGDDPVETMEAADQVASQIDEAFSTKLFNPETEVWQEIKLLSCQSISEDDITVSNVRKLMHWQLEHISLKAGEEPGPHPA